MSDFDDLLARLEASDDALTRPVAHKLQSRLSDEDRTLARFSEINRFYSDHGREPTTQTNDPHEVGLAASLDAYRVKTALHELIEPIDVHGLLKILPTIPSPSTMDDILLLDSPIFDDDHSLHEPMPETPEERAGIIDRAKPEEMATRWPCLVFDVWRPVFDKIRNDVNRGDRKVTPATWSANIDVGHAFILKGHLAVIAEVNDVPNMAGGTQQRLRVIYDNATESNHLVESFAKALWLDDNSRRISHPDGSVGGLFEMADEKDSISCDGRIYVARSLSTNESLAQYVPLILKIGRTGGEVASRIAQAHKHATYLYAPVEIVDIYALKGYKANEVETALHAFFAPSALHISITDGLGRKIEPREWFMVSKDDVAKAIQLILERRLGQHRYDAAEQRITEKSVDEDGKP